MSRHHDVVEARHADVERNAEVELPQRRHHPEGDLVGRAKTAVNVAPAAIRRAIARAPPSRVRGVSTTSRSSSGTPTRMRAAP